MQILIQRMSISIMFYLNKILNLEYVPLIPNSKVKINTKKVRQNNKKMFDLKDTMSILIGFQTMQI